MRLRFDSVNSDQQDLEVGARNPQESGRKAPLSCNVVFQCSNAVSFVAVQLLVKLRPRRRKASVAMQLLQRNFPKNAARLLLSLGACCRGHVGLRGMDWALFRPTLLSVKNSAFLSCVTWLTLTKSD